MSVRRTALWTVLDQVLLSAVHFAAGLIVLRLCDKPAYGTYVIGWSLLMVMSGFQNAFLNTQMTVRAAGLEAHEREHVARRYLRDAVAALGALLLIAAPVSAAAALIRPNSDLSALVITISLAFVGVAARDLARSYLLLSLRARDVLAIDALYAVGLGLFTAAAMALMPRGWLHLAILTSIGAASLIAAFLPLKPLASCHRTFGATFRALRELVNQGGWAAAGVAVTYLQAQSYVYLLGSISGLAATAEASAARLLLTPASLINSSLQRAVYPHQVSLVRRGALERLDKIAQLAVIGMLAGTTAWVGFLLLAEGPVLALVLGAEYASVSRYVWAFGVLIGLEAIRSIASSQLQAFAFFRQITLVNTATAVVVIVASFIAIPRFGILGSVLSQAIGEILLALGLWGLLIRRKAERRAHNT